MTVNSEKEENLFFETLFFSYYSPLLRYVRKYIYDRSVGEDIVQDVFLSVWNKRKDIDFELQPILPYLYKIAQNKSLNYLRSQQYRSNMDSDLDFQIHEEVSRYNQHDTLLMKDADNEIKSCTEKLPPQCQKVFLSSRHELLKNREIAEKFEISEKAVEKHITHALQKIRECLRKAGILS